MALNMELPYSWLLVLWQNGRVEVEAKDPPPMALGGLAPLLEAAHLQTLIQEAKQ